ncbi:hypothetical protein GCM10022378_12880 [Salinicoccus jeotgali]|uniref:Uncharacterized protein n=1 Tax=Salinicoccus jeotgali TaxID=381634 RepID=A0ABP7EY48_9STAP
MKTIRRSHALSENHLSEIIARDDFDIPNLALPPMKKALHPETEYFVSLNHMDEHDPFLLQNLVIETIRMIEGADGFVTDQIFTNDHHHINHRFLDEISIQTGERHLIIGPSFSRVPSFLQSRLLDELVDADVSGIMFDVRSMDIDDFAALQPLAKLKIHAKKRIAIIPVVKDEHQRNALVDTIPFDVVCIAD